MFKRHWLFMICQLRRHLARWWQMSSALLSNNRREQDTYSMFFSTWCDDCDYILKMAAPVVFEQWWKITTSVIKKITVWLYVTASWRPDFWNAAKTHKEPVASSFYKHAAAKATKTDSWTAWKWRRQTGATARYGPPYGSHILPCRKTKQHEH